MHPTSNRQLIRFKAASPSETFSVSQCRGRKSGFTLIEILIVITIIVVLAGIVFTASRKMLSSARSATCAGNLREVSVAVAGYSADNHMKIPPYVLNNPDGTGYSPLFEVLRPYLGGGDRLTEISACECPEQKITKSDPLEFTLGYSGNPQLLVNGRDSDHGGSQAPEDLGPLVRMAAVHRPAEVFLFIDAGQREPSGWATTILNKVGKSGGESKANDQMTGRPFMDDEPEPGGGSVYYRHNGKANVLFLDGHVESIQKGEIRERNVFIDY